MKVFFQGLRKAETKKQLILRWLLLLALVSATGGGMFGLGLYVVMSKDVPDFSSLDEYRPRLTTRVFGQEGQLVGEFFREKRIVVPYERIPKRLVQAFLSSEDDRFFDHEGIDYLGILRAAIANIRAGRVVQGGSTVTQQVAKSIIISAEGYQAGTAKKLSRKIKEAILARRLEKRLTKEEILSLYLNQIFLGNQAYGVQAAAENYFRKNVEDMNLAEMALLAGLPQAPSRYSPFRHPKRAKKRREYVLRRLLDEGFITQTELDEAEATPIKVYPARNLSREVTPYFTEHVRRELFDKYGEEAVLDQGLTVYTTVDVERYRAAEDAVYKKLRMVDKRQGYRGALMRLESEDEVTDFLTKYDKELERLGRKTKLEDGELYVGLITRIDREKQNIYVSIGPHQAVLPISGMRWARGVDPNKWFEGALLRKIPTKLFQKGDVIHVRTTTYEKIKKDKFSGPFLKWVPKKVQLVALEQEPDLETALLSTEVESGYVVAMLGGYSFDRSEFNRSLQSCRQPGSAFKPIVYCAALDIKDWTLAHTVLDAPLTFDDPTAKKRWRPQNFETKFLGEVTIRTALQNSMNVPAIKVLDAVGVGEAIRFAQKVGISSPLPPELGIALGQGCVTMGELSEVYRLFANYGAKEPRKFITRVIDRDGKVLFDNAFHSDPWIGVDRKVERMIRETANPPERILDRQTGFLITKMMRNVVMGGTGTPAQRLGVPVAGKTGTTNDSFDAWFMGFTTELVTAAWVGYDNYQMPMGRYEQGGRAALPIWLAYMKAALKGQKSGEFAPPPGIVFARIDPKTGKLARQGTIGAVREPFRKGTEPREFVSDAQSARSDEFFLEDNL